jgi:cyclopropane-fatty-acyl-phospholipid synthase
LFQNKFIKNTESEIMFFEKKLEQWAERIRRHSALPLRVELWNGRQFSFSREKPKVIVHVPDQSALSYLFVPSLSNLGRAYVESQIEVEGEPHAIISVGNALASMTLKPIGKFARMVYSRRHNKKIDQKAVKYHYDVSNEFYKLWLDKNMVYSCAYFETGEEDLETAQNKKIDHILNKIQLRSGDTLLDIGCGWGALLIRAAQQYGVRCTGVTISENQAKLAKKLVFEAGLANKVNILLQDYRDVKGRFDRITSVGMFEHVGIDQLTRYFSTIQSLLVDDGIALNHGITTTDSQNGGAPFGGGEFIEKYVFPHGELPHISSVLNAMQKGGLEVFDVENLRRHYAKTCAVWSDNFEKNPIEIKRLAGEKKYRIWRLYLAGCAYAFNQDWISLYQVVCFKSGRDPKNLPWSRHHMY